MIPNIKLLFVGPPSKTTIDNQLLLLSNTLPLNGHFEETSSDARAYLQGCTTLNFPDVIILDEDLGKTGCSDFLQDYRQHFYIHQIDTLLYISSTNATALKTVDKYPLVSGQLCKPLNKSVFLKEIYPMISFTMV